MEWVDVIVLIIAGVFVGFINTLAGGGSIISLSVLMLMGLPPTVANGTNRIAIFIQTLTASASFRHQKVLDIKKAVLLSIPAVIGSVVGALIAVDINEKIFQRFFAGIMLVMLVFILYKPHKYLHGREELVKKKITVWQVIVFFFIGIYGGFIQAGIGYFLLAGIVLGAGYNLVKANAVKVTIALFITIFALVIFIINGDVKYFYGLILGVGTIAGALIASRLAVKKGVNFVRWVIIVLIVVFASHFFGLFDINEFIGQIIK